MLPGLAGLVNKITERVLEKDTLVFVWVAAMFKGHSKGSGLYMCDFTKKNLIRTPTGIAGHDFLLLGYKTERDL